MLLPWCIWVFFFFQIPLTYSSQKDLLGNIIFMENSINKELLKFILSQDTMAAVIKSQFSIPNNLDNVIRMPIDRDNSFQPHSFILTVTIKQNPYHTFWTIKLMNSLIMAQILNIKNWPFRQTIPYIHVMRLLVNSSQCFWPAIMCVLVFVKNYMIKEFFFPFFCYFVLKRKTLILKKKCTILYVQLSQKTISVEW